MSDKFEVGEVAIYVRPGSPSYGCEVTIASTLIMSIFNTAEAPDVSDTAWVYLLDEICAETGLQGCAEPHELRKKPPAREDHQLVKWSECPWQPSRERA